jgi:hypothetical protein
MSEQVQVKIKGIVATQRYGTLESGDILRTDADFAKFLVEDCQAADYLDAQAAPAEPAEAPPKAAAKKPKSAK